MSATTSGSSCRNNASSCPRPNYEEGRPKFAVRLVVASYFPVVRRCARNIARLQDWLVRRLLFTLAHAHGTLLALVNIAAGLTARSVVRFDLRPSVSFALIWAAILLPAGFFLGGIVIYGGDPGLGVWLVPVGAILLFYSVARIALDLSKLK